MATIPPSLLDLLQTILPIAIQQLADSHHVQRPPRTDLEVAFVNYAYSFANDPRWSSAFQPFRPFSGHLQSSAGNSEDDLNSGQDEDVDEDSDEEGAQTPLWSLATAQARAEAATSNGLGQEYSRARKGKACGHIFRKGESVYRCKECSLDDSCVLCSKCFKASDHVNHEVAFTMHSGGCGCCDCGDPEAWKREIGCAYHSTGIPHPDDGAENTEDTYNSDNPPLPLDLETLLRGRVQEALDFAIEAISRYPHTTKEPPSPRAISSIQPSFRFPNETLESFSGFSGPWSVMLWNDEKHTYQQVIAQLVQSTRCSKQHAYAAATRVDSYGRETVATSTDANKLWKIAQTIGSIDLGVSVCTSRDAVIHQAVGLVIDWLLDLVKVRVNGEHTVMARIVAQVILRDHRLASMLLIEDRLWKRARTSFRHLLMALLIVGQDAKMEIAVQYASVYPSLTSSYLLTDREPDNSVTHFSIQLFSAPSIATHLVVNHNFLSTIIQILYSFFTQQHGGPTPSEKAIAFPPSAEHPAADPDSTSFRNKRYPAVFHELHHLLSHPGVLENLANQPEHLAFRNALSFLGLFTGMNPLVRAVSAHVEYEAETWVTAFNLAIQLSKLARLAGRAFHPSQGLQDPPTGYALAPDAFLSALTYVVAQLKTRYAIDNAQPDAMHTVSFAGREYNVVKFQVSKEPVSFHHPLHLIFAEMLKNIEGWEDAEISEVSNGYCCTLQELLEGQSSAGQPSYLCILDEVIRVLALASQIRAGLWVRNGFGVRAQGLHYREYTLRENTFDQDIYLLQTAFVTTDPSLIFVSLLDRFELLPILEYRGIPPVSSDKITSPYDLSQALTMLDELLYLLIIIFTEPADIEALSAEATVRRELVHTLLLGPYSYSEIHKNVTDRVQEESSFDRVLTDVATFRPADIGSAASDVGGVYVLKKECYSEIDPYYYRYSRNQREEAAKLLASRNGGASPFRPRKTEPKGSFQSVRESLEGTLWFCLSWPKRTRNGGASPFRPRKTEPKGSFQRLSDALLEPAFLQLLEIAFELGTQDPKNHAETVIDSVIHLVDIGLVERGVTFSGQLGDSLLSRLVQMSQDDRVKEQHARIKAIEETVYRLEPMRRGPSSPSEMEEGQVQRASEVEAAKAVEQRKQAAKARQAAIMQQFAEAQKNFMDANVTSDEEEEEEDEAAQADNDLNSRLPGGFDEPMSEDNVPSKEGDPESRSRRKRREHQSLGSCIVCQEDLNSQKPFGSLALVQTSGLVRLQPQDPNLLQEVYQVPPNLDKAYGNSRPFGIAGQETSESAGRGGTSFGFPHTSKKKGLFASACGHLMHVSCFDTYCASIASRHSSQLTRNHPENPDRKEFICPLCKSLGNILLPLSEDDHDGSYSAAAASAALSREWLEQAAASTLPQAPDLKAAIMHTILRAPGGHFGAWIIQESLPLSDISLNASFMSESEKHMLERLMQVVAPLDVESRMLDGEGGERAVRTIPQELLAYTLSAIEIALRGKSTGTLHSESIPKATSTLLRSLLYAAERLVILHAGTPRGLDFARLTLLWTILGPQAVTAIHRHFLDRDPLVVLVESAIVAPEDFYCFASFAFYSHILRTSHKLYSNASDSVPPAVPAAQPNPDAEALADFCLMVQDDRWERSGERHKEGVTEHLLQLRAKAAFEQVYAHALPFLRRAAILHNVLFQTTPEASDEGTEFSRLLRLLCIVHPRELVGRRHGKSAHRETPLVSLIQTWDREWLSYRHTTLPASVAMFTKFRQNQSTTTEVVELEHPVIYELLGLPKHIDLLIESSVNRKCNRCRTVPSEPAICLLCGQLVCQQLMCCMDQDLDEETVHGECNTHMWECGVSSGIYFLIKKCVIIYLYADKGTFVTAPYLDSHGEADPGLRKRRPLYLSQPRYDEIRKIWLNHSIATVVARRLEAGNDAGGWNSF